MCWFFFFKNLVFSVSQNEAREPLNVTPSNRGIKEIG